MATILIIAGLIGLAYSVDAASWAAGGCSLTLTLAGAAIYGWGCC